MLNLKILESTNEVFKRLNILRRWTSTVNEAKYNELSKQALNCIITYLLASYCEEAEKEVDWERFPKIAIYRAFQKVYVYFDTPEHIMDEVRKIGNIPKVAFNDVTKKIISESTDNDFEKMVSEGTNTFEMQIYRAATKIATLVELYEIKSHMDAEKYSDKVQQIRSSLGEFSDMPGISELSDSNGMLFKVLVEISKLRNQNRWSVMSYTVEASVLGHLFDTAIFAYFISLDKEPEDEKLATQMFFMGIFHDLAEVWTTDIPSPIKDRIQGFRKATEEYELKVIQEKLYNRVPEFLAKKIKEVMFEDADNIQFKKLLKGADYLSADAECWRQYKGGSRDEYFLQAMLRNSKALEEDRIDMGTLGKELHENFIKYAVKCLP